MNNKKYILASLAVILLGLFAVYEKSQTVNAHNENPELELNAHKNPQPFMDSSTDPVAMPVAATATKNQPANIGDSHLAERLAAMHSRRPDLVFEPAAVDAALKRNATWAPAQTIPKHLPLKPEEFTDGRQFIQFDVLKLESLMPGDTLKVNISEDRRDYDVIIDSVEKNDYNSISWFGHIDGGDGQSYSVSFTRGAQLTVGGVDTPEGHYVLQAHGSDGWIASSKLLFKVTPGDNDQVYPPNMEPKPIKPN